MNQHPCSELVISVSQLQRGAVVPFTVEAPASLLELEEEEVVPLETVKISGRAYLLEQDLIAHFDAETKVKMPCAICNEWVTVPLKVTESVQTIPTSEVGFNGYDLAPLVREELILALPQFVECNEGNCPKRKELKKSRAKSSNNQEGEEGYHPFAGL
jgi:uncharacterized metal-binding protein YceD (DUF177 family)